MNPKTPRDSDLRLTDPKKAQVPASQVADSTSKTHDTLLDGQTLDAMVQAAISIKGCVKPQRPRLEQLEANCIALMDGERVLMFASRKGLRHILDCYDR